MSIGVRHKLNFPNSFCVFVLFVYFYKLIIVSAFALERFLQAIDCEIGMEAVTRARC